jgi:lipoic acid synthetase
MQRPSYAKKKINFRDMHLTESVLSGLDLHTVCHQARCPNISECFGRGTATFLILGDICTRGCSFCNMKRGTPAAVDRSEAKSVAEAVQKLKLKYAVITSVTRDDLPDGGAAQFAQVIRLISSRPGIKGQNEGQSPDTGVKVEVLVPDFKADIDAIKTVMDARPFVFAHNVETVPSLYSVRKGADYKRSLEVLKAAKDMSVRTKIKSAVMLGLGEKEGEVLEVFNDLVRAGCDYISIGQYLQPDKDRCPVKEYVKPEKFDRYKEKAYAAGFKHVESGVWVRSSYKAEEYR